MDEQQNTSDINQSAEPVSAEAVAVATEPEIKPSQPEVISETEAAPSDTAPEQVKPEAVPEAKPLVRESNKSLTNDDKLFAAISYLSILFVVPLIVKKDDQFVAFHLKQGMGLFAAEVIAWVALWLIESFLTATFSYRTIGLILLLNNAAWLLFAALSLVGVYYAFTGETKKLPWIDRLVTRHIKL